MIFLSRTFKLSVLQLGTSLVVGSNFWKIEIGFFEDAIRIIFLGFFIVLPYTIYNTKLHTRLKSILFGAAYFLIVIIAEFILVILALRHRFNSFIYQTIDLILIYLLGLVFIELMFFKIINLPNPVRINTEIKRDRKLDYSIFLSTLIFSFSIMYVLTYYLFRFANSPGFDAYIGSHVFIFLTPYPYIAYILRGFRKRKNCLEENYHPPITFLIPAYNEEEFIGACIESIDRASGKYPGIVDIIVVNDGSTDNTGSMAEEALSKNFFAGGMVQNQMNLGKGSALNNGLRVAKGELIFRMDADSKIDENAIIPVIRHFIDPCVGGVSGRLKPLNEESLLQKLEHMRFLTIWMIGRISQECLDSMMVHAGVFSVYRRDVLNKLGGWVEDINGEDGDMTIRVGRLGYRNEFEEEAIMYTDTPREVSGLRKQRVRWNRGYYQAYARNMSIISMGQGVRGIFTFPMSIIQHARSIMSLLIWEYMLVISVIGAPVFKFWVDFWSVTFFFIILRLIPRIYLIMKQKKYHLLKYLALYPFFGLLIQIFKLEATQTLLSDTNIEEADEEIEIDFKEDIELIEPLIETPLVATRA